MKQSLAACVVMASLAMGKKMEKGKSTLEVEWKNSKGEKKHFTINDIEKEFKPEEIRGQTFLQEGIKTIGKLEGKEGRCGCDSGYRRKGRYCAERSRSNSIDDCRGTGRYKYPSSSRSHSHSSRSSRSSSRGSVEVFKRDHCGYRRHTPEKYDHFDKCDDDYAGYRNLKPYKRGKLRRAYRKGKARKIINECRRRRYRRGASKDKIDFDNGGKYFGKRRSISRDDYTRRIRSRSGPRRNVYVMQHRPRYDIRGWDVGCEPRVQHYPIGVNHYNRRAADQAYINRNRDARRKAVNLDDVNRMLKNERARRNMINAAAQNSRNNQNAKESKKYLNKNNKINKQNYNREACAADLAESGKNANKFNANLSNNRAQQRHHSLDAKHTHNLMNIKDRSKEGLCMNEIDNDNLRSDQKVIEEFDKLEHYKKVDERNRSAEKNNNCNVKKRNDIDKNAKQCSRHAAKGKRRRGAHAYRNNNRRNAFDYNQYANKQANKKIFTDQDSCYRDNKYLKACADARSNQNNCQDANSCEMDKQDYDNLLAKCNDRRMRNRNYGYNDRVCALRDQNLCNDEYANDAPCDY